jgi:hypothetical protein
VCFQRLLDDGYSSSFSIREDCLDRLLKVFFIWVAEDHRRRSIGTGLIGAAQHGIGRAKPYVAWCHPLSRDARELARALQPDAAPLVFHSC